MNKLLLAGKVAGNYEQLETISNLLNTRVLNSPTYRKLSSVCNQFSFDILHIIGETKTDGKKIYLYFKDEAQRISPMQIAGLIQSGGFKLVFLSCNNGAQFATQISKYADCIFLNGEIPEDSQWEFPIRFYSLLERTLREEKRFRPLKSFRITDQENSGYGYISRLDDKLRDLQSSDFKVSTQTITVIMDYKTLALLTIASLFSLIATSLSFISFLMSLLQ